MSSYSYEGIESSAKPNNHGWWLMPSWQVSNLGDGLMAWEPLQRIESLFHTTFSNAGEPVDMAIFSRHETTAGLHCEVRVYFSPAAAELAGQFDARSCARPQRPGLNLLAGDALAWEQLFDEA